MLSLLPLCSSAALVLQTEIRPWTLRLPEGQIFVGFIAAAIVLLCVVLHYEMLGFLHYLMSRLKPLHRPRLLVLIPGLMLTHLLEIWIFAFGFIYLEGRLGYGEIAGGVCEGVLDYVYYSVSCYTSLGFGDLVPLGPMRFLTAIEALAGLILLGWSASFTFLEMQRFWK